MAFPLEPDGEQLRALLQATAEHVVDFAESLPHRPASDLDGVAGLLPAMTAPPPEDAQPPERVLAAVTTMTSKGFETAGPGYLAFIPGGGVVAAAVGDMLACAVNRFVNRALPAPLAAAVEHGLVRWMASLVGLPASAGGVLTSGGSLANFSAIVTARQAVLGDDPAGGMVYASAEAHHSIAKAARLAGLGRAAVRVIPVGDDQRADPVAADEAVQHDIAAGLRPCCLVATAGTTGTGAIDPLGALADVAARHGMWFHVDGAYGGLFALTERGRSRLTGIERADSVTLDPHKSLFLPFGLGCLLVRDEDRLRAAHSETLAHYLEDTASDLGVPDFAELSPELSRDFRGLRLWFPLQLHGVAAFREALDEKLDLTEAAYRTLSGDERFEVLAAPELTVFAFRLASADGRASDEATAELVRRVNAERRVFLSTTRVGGRLFGRICILSHRTHADRVDEAVGALRRHAVLLSSPD